MVSHILVNLRNGLGLSTPPCSGFAFRKLTVHGSGPAVEQQDTIWTLLTSLINVKAWIRPKHSKTILQDLDGVVQKGELFLVLGRPGSDCTTFLKTITGECVAWSLTQHQFYDKVIYNQEVDEHPPCLTVEQTLEFAAAMRTPRARLPHITRKERIKHVVEVMLSVFDLSHTRNTIVGNVCVRGVSGGERKRVSIAETALSEAAISHEIILPTALMPNPPYILFVGYRRAQRRKDTKISCQGPLKNSKNIGMDRQIFYGTPETSDAFFSYESVLFFSVLLNALMYITDIHNLYKGRSVVRKQASYVFYRPSAEVLASIIVDIPVKLVVGTYFNIILYFLSGLATTASESFIFFLFVFVTTLAMSMAVAISGCLVLALVTYKGFVLPGPYMHPWFKWISYINPLSYAFEALLVNQAHGANYPCSHLVPPYPNLTGDSFICPRPPVVRSAPLEGVVNEAVPMQVDRETFSLRKVSLDVMTEGHSRRLLDNSCGWVKPDSLTALMDVLGAGKTTLLDALAQRTPSGVIQDEFYVDGRPLPASFKSDVSYAQQQGVHLETSTRFDRLLLMARGRKVAYFGGIGRNSETVLRADAENPAEYLLDAIGNTNIAKLDWPRLWHASAGARVVSIGLERVVESFSTWRQGNGSDVVQARQRGAYSMSLLSQIPGVCVRAFQQYWRSPTHIPSKFMVGVAGLLLIGFSFQPGQSILGVQNAIFSVLMVCAMSSSLVQQIMSKFIVQRTLYEVRERHSNMYSWSVFILANMLVEIPYHVVLGVMTSAIFNYTSFCSTVTCVSSMFDFSLPSSSPPYSPSPGPSAPTVLPASPSIKPMAESSNAFCSGRPYQARKHSLASMTSIRSRER
ncbi:ABC-2 type transporter-domain-containing protein [Fusarium oxysporum]|nr:ABC-2 type transporter-domain-containing protein [Fusarium oxysporum]